MSDFIESAFLAVNSWMQMGPGIAALGCLAWGTISVILSPCNVASLPLIVSYMAGQEGPVAPRQGILCALSFTLGVFITITAVGIVCTLLGRMLGEVGPLWSVLLGALLLWVGIDMLGVVKCPLPSRLCGCVKLRGFTGAFCLGLAYGVISGSCTFGFIAPILALITVQDHILTGVISIVLFGVGYSIPIAVAAGSMAKVKKLIQNSSFQKGSLIFRKFAGVSIGLLGIYFIVKPIFENLP